MRIVLDTNCLIQIISPHSEYHNVWLSLTKGQNVLCISNEIIEEYVEILERLFNHNFAEAVVKTIVNSPFVEYVAPFYKFELIKSDQTITNLLIVLLLQMLAILSAMTIIMMF